MHRAHLFVVAAAGILSGLAAVTWTSDQPAHAETAQARAFAEHACLDYGVAPSTPAHESCVARAARAFERGEPDVAYMQARATRDAREACLGYGLPMETLGYQQCVATQVERRTEPKMLIRQVPRPIE
jgi:hypothetical protein